MLTRRALVCWTAAAAVALFALAATEVGLLRNPEPLFAWSARAGDLSLYSDQPFTAAEAAVVLADAQRRLERSTLYGGARADAAFICNTAWRRLIFGAGNYRAGGLNYAPITTNVYLSGADVGRNRLISPGGKHVTDERTLGYFIAHEIAHSLTQEHVGVFAYWRLPAWLREAYADLVARGSMFPRLEARRAFLANTPEMNWPAEAPYLRYNLLLGQLLENEQLSLDEVWRRRITQPDAEQRLRTFLSTNPERS